MIKLWFSLIIYFFSLSLFSLSLFSQECKELEHDIILSEAQMQKSCLKPVSEDQCCLPREGADLDCLSKKDLEIKYNQTLGNLVIQEGIQAISQAIENNHNTLSRLKKDQLKHAHTTLTNLKKSLRQAVLLYEALDFKNLNNIFNQYQGKTTDALRAHLNKQCSNDIEKFENFCSVFKKFKDDKLALETLSGFLNADGGIHDPEVKKQKRYQSYQEALMIEDDQRNYTPSQFLSESDYAKKVTYLSKTIKSWVKENDSLAGEIVIAVANNLNQIQVGFSNSSSTSSDVTNFLNKKIKSHLNNLDLPELILTPGLKENFQNATERLEKEHQKHEASLKKEVEKFLSDNANAENSKNENIQSLCSDKDGFTCLDQLCDDKDICPNFSDIDLNEIYQKHRALKREKKTYQNLLSSKQCFDQKTLEEQRDCLSDISTQSDIAQLRRELKKLKMALSQLDKTKKFKKLNQFKVLSLKALESKNCLKENQKSELPTVKGGDCFQTPLASLSGIIELVSDSDKAMITLDLDQAKKEIKSSSKLKEMEDNFITSCRKTKSEDPLCNYYKKENQVAKKMQRKKRSRRLLRSRREQMRKKREKEKFWDGVKYFAGAIGQQLPSLSQDWAQTEQLKWQTDSEIRRIRAYDHYYMSNLPGWRDMFNRPYAYLQENHWATTTPSTDYQSLSTFQNHLSSQQLLFKNTSGLDLSIYTPSTIQI